MNAIVARAWAELEPLAPAWESFAPHSLTSPALARSYLGVQGGAARCFAIAVFDEGERLQAIAPWAIVRRGGGVRVLTGLGEDYAFEHDPLFAPGADREAVARALVAALREHRHDWDALELNLRASACDPLLAHLGQLGWLRFGNQEWRSRPAADFTEGWEAFVSSRCREYVGNVRRRSRRLGSTPHRFVAADESNLEAILSRLFELHAARWADRDWTHYHAVMRDLALDALSRDSLYLHGLEIRESLAAILLVLRRGDWAYMIMQAFDPRFASYSAGTLVTHRCLEILARDGVRTVDMGPGNQEWKRRLRSRTIDMVQPAIARLDSPQGIARVAWVGLVKPWLRAKVVATV